MKKTLAILLALSCLFGLVGCGDRSMDDIIENEPSITGVVTKVYENSFLMLGEATGNYAAEEYSVSLNVENGDSYTSVSVGDEVVVYHNGEIAESDPLQINTVYAITLKTPASEKTNSIPFDNLAPGEEATYPSTVSAFTNDAWLDYSITYSPATLKLIIGLRGEDGTEYTAEITSDNNSGKITGFPSGNYTVFVRSSEESLNVTGVMNFVVGAKVPEDITYFGKG